MHLVNAYLVKKIHISAKTFTLICWWRCHAKLYANVPVKARKKKNRKHVNRDVLGFDRI